MREDMDTRLRSVKLWDEVVSGIEGDLGGDLTTIQTTLVRAYASAAVEVSDLGMQRLKGEKVDLNQLFSGIGCLVRIASRLGIHRVARSANGADVTLGDVLKAGPAP